MFVKIERRIFSLVFIGLGVEVSLILTRRGNGNVKVRCSDFKIYVFG